jgi:threonine aldolase
MIDLRSDTVTLPTDEMWEAMRSVPLRDDTLEGDPTVRQLESLAAGLTGKQDAVFVASGTMANVIAALTHGRTGGEALVDDQAHIAKSESGGMSRLAGLFCVCLPSRHGEMNLGQLHDNLRTGYSKSGPPTAMVCVETSHNHSGGYVPSLGYMETVAKMAHQAGTAVHVDGARAFNAAHALGVDVATIARHCDSMSFCLSKGLSAPMGSLLVGSSEFVNCARTFRRMLGGGLRQSGIMAAAGLVALGKMTDRLADDHRRARSLWEKLYALDARLVDADPPQTNIVRLIVADVPGGDAIFWEQQLERHRVLTRAAGRSALRLVTHRHIGDSDIEATCAAIAGILMRHDAGCATA